MIRCGRSEAVDRARRSLHQHYTVIRAEVQMERGLWIVTARVGFLPEQVKSVRIDSGSGTIVGCT